MKSLTSLPPNFSPNWSCTAAPVYLKTKNSGVSWTGTLSGEVPHLFRLVIVGHLNLVTKQGMDSSEHLLTRVPSLAGSCSSKIKQCSSNCPQVLDYQQALKCLPAFTQQQGPSDILQACFCQGRYQYPGKMTQRLFNVPLISLAGTSASPAAEMSLDWHFRPCCFRGLVWNRVSCWPNSVWLMSFCRLALVWHWDIYFFIYLSVTVFTINGVVFL